MQNTASNIIRLAKNAKQVKSLAFGQCSSFGEENGDLVYSFADGSKLFICKRTEQIRTN